METCVICDNTAERGDMYARDIQEGKQKRAIYFCKNCFANKTKHDPVKHPSHYTMAKKEPPFLQSWYEERTWPLTRKANLWIVVLTAVSVLIVVILIGVKLYKVNVKSEFRQKVEKYIEGTDESLRPTKPMLDSQDNQYEAYFVGDQLFVADEPYQRGKQ